MTVKDIFRHPCLVEEQAEVYRALIPGCIGRSEANFDSDELTVEAAVDIQ
jgi:hypothetical protein